MTYLVPFRHNRLPHLLFTRTSVHKSTPPLHPKPARPTIFTVLISKNPFLRSYCAHPQLKNPEKYGRGRLRETRPFIQVRVGRILTKWWHVRSGSKERILCQVMIIRLQERSYLFGNMENFTNCKYFSYAE